jgi:hypothetical protein
VIIAMCVSLMKELRAEPYESTLPSRVRRAVQYVQLRDQQKQHAVALTALGANHEEILPDARQFPRYLKRTGKRSPSVGDLLRLLTQAGPEGVADTPSVPTARQYVAGMRTRRSSPPTGMAMLTDQHGEAAGRHTRRASEFRRRPGYAAASMSLSKRWLQRCLYSYAPAGSARNARSSGWSMR